jgi:hypothetical protein
MINTPPRDLVEEAERALLERKDCTYSRLDWSRLVAKLLTEVKRLRRHPPDRA